MIERYSYGHGARVERETVQPVSLMEVCMADNRMPCTCPDCGIVHDGLHGHGLQKVNKVCADCYELRRGKGIKRAAGYRREIRALRKALAYAIGQADGWYDECRGGRLDTPGMDAARKLLEKTE